MKWHTGLPENWADLPDPVRGKREIPPEPDVSTSDQEHEMTETDGVLVVWRKRSSRAFLAGNYIDLEKAR